MREATQHALTRYMNLLRHTQKTMCEWQMCSWSSLCLGGIVLHRCCSHNHRFLTLQLNLHVNTGPSALAQSMIACSYALSCTTKTIATPWMWAR